MGATIPQQGGQLTWDNVPGVHGILVFDKTKAIHKLDFGDFSRAMGSKVVLDVGLGSYPIEASVVARFGETVRACGEYGPLRGRFPR